jgi:hypothetical protein
MTGRLYKQTIQTHKLYEGMTLEISFVEIPSFRLRKWLAIRLVRLAAILLGCGIEVKE